MVIPVEAKLKQIVEQQRDYPWPRPEPCPRCQEPRVWGHGFVAAYFDEYPAQLLLRRFRCPGCGERNRGRVSIINYTPFFHSAFSGNQTPAVRQFLAEFLTRRDCVCGC